MIELDTIVQADALEWLRTLPDESVDAVITDPPYGIGLDEWDKPIDVPVFLNETYRILKKPGFLAWFGQMPTLADWLAAIQSTPFRFKEHIVWAKRSLGNYAAGLNRTHESIMIYVKGTANFVEVKGRYSDIKVPGLLYDTTSTEALSRYIDGLWARANGRPNGKIMSSRRHMAYFRRGYKATERDVEFANFTNLWSFAPEYQTSRMQQSLIHATVKPVKLMRRLIELLSEPQALICDPFIGTGTTAIAAQLSDRHFIGSEINSQFLDFARRKVEVLDPYQNTPINETMIQLGLFTDNDSG